MNIIKRLINCNISPVTAVFCLRNGDFVITAFQQNEESGETLLINPMLIMTTQDEVTGEEGLTLDPYINPKIVNGLNFFIETSDIFSVHEPTVKMFEFYGRQIARMRGIPVDPEEGLTADKRKKKAKANNVVSSANNVIYVKFGDKANTKDSLVNIYKEEELPDPDPDPPAAA